MSGQGKYKRCTHKGCRVKAVGCVLDKGDDYCPHHLRKWAEVQVVGLGDFGIALKVYIAERVYEAVSEATDKATTQTR